MTNNYKTYTVKQFRELPIEEKVNLINNRLNELKEQGKTTKEFKNDELQMSYSTASRELAQEGYEFNYKEYKMQYNEEKHKEMLEAQEAEITPTFQLGSLNERLERLEIYLAKLADEPQNNKKEQQESEMLNRLSNYNKYEKSLGTAELIPSSIRIEKEIKENLQQIVEEYPVQSLNQLINIICYDFLKKHRKE